jgi:hypothetical protein
LINFQPPSLHYIQLLLSKDVLETLVTSIHVTSLAIQMLSPYLRLLWLDNYAHMDSATKMHSQ